MPRYKLFPRYWRLSWRTMLGVTRTKRRIRRASGYYAATRLFRAPYNFRRRTLRRAGYYSAPMMLMRALMRGVRRGR